MLFYKPKQSRKRQIMYCKKMLNEEFVRHSSSKLDQWDCHSAALSEAQVLQPVPVRGYDWLHIRLLACKLLGNWLINKQFAHNVYTVSIPWGLMTASPNSHFTNLRDGLGVSGTTRRNVEIRFSRFGDRGSIYTGQATWNTPPSDLHDITDTSTFRKRPVLDHAYN